VVERTSLRRLIPGPGAVPGEGHPVVGEQDQRPEVIRPAKLPLLPGADFGDALATSCRKHSCAEIPVARAAFETIGEEVAADTRPAVLLHRKSQPDRWRAVEWSLDQGWISRERLAVTARGDTSS